MSHPYFFICPNCRSEESIENETCRSCQCTVRVSGVRLVFNGKEMSTAAYFDELLSKIPLNQSATFLDNYPDKSTSDSPLLRVSGPAVLRQGGPARRFSGYHDLFSMSLRMPEKTHEGVLLMYKDRAEFRTDKTTVSWNLEDFTCVTTNSHYFEFKIRNEPFYQIHFHHESALKYELVFRKWLDAYYDHHPDGPLVEYQPRIQQKPPRPSRRLWSLPQDAPESNAYLLEKCIFDTIRFLIKVYLSLRVRVEIVGKENWRKEMRGILIMNHQSSLDPFAFGAFNDRQIAFLTKSTEFPPGLKSAFLRGTLCIPTTRYQNDPQVVYAIRSMLRRGKKVGIYPEGERTWDGRLLPFKLGTVKIMMASREPILPVVVRGMFNFRPRWAGKVSKARVQFRICAPFSLIPDKYPVEEQARFLEGYFREALGETPINS